MTGARFASVCAIGLAAVGVGGCGSHRVVPKQATGCNSEVRADVLPSWARGGFSNPRPRMPHVLGASGNIAALLFGYPLLSPPPGSRQQDPVVSRIATDPSSDLRIAAQLMMGSRPVGSAIARRVMGEPGPSTIDLPSPGCWRLTWSGNVDRLDLRYGVNRTA
jgi:hypothetical protein